MRQVRPYGRDDFLRDRFDSVYRRNLLDTVDHVDQAEKKRKLKNAYKFKLRSGTAYEGLTEKLDKKNKRKKKELDAKSKTGFLKDDLILL